MVGTADRVELEQHNNSSLLVDTIAGGSKDDHDVNNLEEVLASQSSAAMKKGDSQQHMNTAPQQLEMSERQWNKSSANLEYPGHSQAYNLNDGTYSQLNNAGRLTTQIKPQVFNGPGEGIDHYKKLFSFSK